MKLKWGRIWVVIGLMVALWSCQKEPGRGFQSVGSILGPDLRLCACCGGWYIRIDSVTYEFDTLPSGTAIDLQKETFPVAVQLDWRLSNKFACPDKRIEILKIKKQ